MRRDFRHAASFAEAGVRPVRVGRLWIGPLDEPAPDEEGLLPVRLAAGSAFGTGTHPSTWLCLHALERHMERGAQVLDLGTGSGILAIAAARLGAGAVLGLDIDPDALDAARANVAHNSLADRVHVRRGTLADLLEGVEEPRRFDWVTVNILARVIVELFEQGLSKVAAPGGWLVLSGFLAGQAYLVRGGVAAAEMELLAQEQQDEWTCVIARRPSG